jgi:hypothetical protein
MVNKAFAPADADPDHAGGEPVITDGQLSASADN